VLEWRLMRKSLAEGAGQAGQTPTCNEAPALDHLAFVWGRVGPAERGASTEKAPVPTIRRPRLARAKHLAASRCAATGSTRFRWWPSFEARVPFPHTKREVKLSSDILAAPAQKKLRAGKMAAVHVRRAKIAPGNALEASRASTSLRRRRKEERLSPALPMHGNGRKVALKLSPAASAKQMIAAESRAR
jgi:hypothetical protein